MSIQFLYKALDHSDQGIIYAWFTSMHTRIDMVLCNKTEHELKGIANQIKEELAQLEKRANYYDPTSELYGVNRKADEHPVVVSNELYTMIESALQYRGRTLGCFDISIQSEGYNKDTWRNIRLLPDLSSVYFQEPGIRIDLSGFLKGYALDKIRKILQDYGILNALISMGNSSVLAMGSHPFGKGWKVGFNGQMNTADSQGIILKGQCLTTSGNETKERKHIIAPHTGGYREGKEQVAVDTASGTGGEVLSTSLFVATPDQWNEIAQSFDIEKIYRF